MFYLKTEKQLDISMIFVMVESHIQHLRLDVVFLAKASNA